MIQKLALWFLFGIAALFVIIQFIPLAGAKTNPAVLAEPQWDSPQTRALAVTACYDCHSNETVWPWYSNVAPISWLVIKDTNKGREYLNFSEWNRPQEEADDASETILEGTMPLRPYLITHPEARLTQQEKTQLAQGLDASFGTKVKADEDDDDND